MRAHFADASGSGATLLEDSFAELAARPELPEFDIIGLHGVWTWISDENSRVIVDFIRRKLRAGGILYISELLAEHPKRGEFSSAGRRG